MHKRLLSLALLASCATAPRPLAVVAVNDVYRVMSPSESPEGGLSRVASLARELARTHDVLVTLGGDFVSPALETTFVSKGRHMIEALDAVEGSADDRVHVVATLGNHEYDLKAPDFCAAFSDTHFTTVAADTVLFPECLTTPLPKWAVRDLGGRKVCLTGTLGQLVPSLGAGAKPLSPEALVSDRPDGCELLLVLTHQDMADDQALAAALRAMPGLPQTLVLGGHEHTGLSDVRAMPWVLKSPSDARRAFVVTFDGDDVRLSDQVLSGQIPPEAPDVVAVGQRWRDKALAARGIDPAIWSQVLWADLPVTIEGEETALRERETTLADLVADAVRHQLGAKGQAVVINTGSLRLGRDVPAGADLTVGHLLETDLFEAELVVVPEVSPEELAAVGRDALIGWPGQGRFPALSANLQLSAKGLEAEGPVNLITTGYMCTNPKGASENPALHALCQARGARVRSGAGTVRGVTQQCLERADCRGAVERDLGVRRIHLSAP